jgi:carbonic anhydrase
VSPWYRLTAPAIVLVSIGLARPLTAQSHHTAHWTYEGESGPAHWGSLDPAFARCAVGHAQSPIDISAPKSHSLPSLALHYQETRISVVNNGHTIEVAYDPGSSLDIEGTRYQLIQFHFHTPSEHTIGGKHVPAELHLVHRSGDGRLAVIGVLMQAGPENTALAPLWNHLPPAEGPAQRVNARINAQDLVPPQHTSYRYDGSLTTPPCSEGVKWIVMATPISLSEQQLEKLTSILHNDSRPVQALDGRTVVSDAVSR